MKIRSLLLGSVAAAGLSTGGAYAADLGVLTSLDVCDSLGLSGLTISSDTNCLQITGEVKYVFKWGDYTDETWADADTAAGSYDLIGGNGYNDWDSRFDAWIKFVATADSDFGPAKAVIKLKQTSQKKYSVEGDLSTVSSAGSSTASVIMDEAYVSIGDSTVIMAGKKGSIMKKGDDEPLNWLGLFNSEKVDTGVSWKADGDYTLGANIADGGHVIQIQSDLGNGISVAAGLENLNESDSQHRAGTAVGVIAYAGDGISAHVTAAAEGVLDGDIEAWGVHAGFAGTFDNFKVVLAGAFGQDDWSNDDYWNVLASASATFDMFTIAASVEANSNDEYGAGASVSATVADGVTLNLGGRYYKENQPTNQDEVYEVAASISAAVTESITLTGTVGYLHDEDPADAFYGSAKLAWAPGGGYTSSVKATVVSGENGYDDMGYKLETEFKKTFE